MGLDLLVDLKRSGVHAYAGAVRREGERELVLRDVDEHREERDERDGPRKEAIHRPNRNRRISCFAGI